VVVIAQIKYGGSFLNDHFNNKTIMASHHRKRTAIAAGIRQVRA